MDNHSNSSDGGWPHLLRPSYDKTTSNSAPEVGGFPVTSPASSWSDISGSNLAYSEPLGTQGIVQADGGLECLGGTPDYSAFLMDGGAYNECAH